MHAHARALIDCSLGSSRALVHVPARARAPALIAYARARALSLLATKVCRLLPAVTCTCSSTSVQQLPPRCYLLAAKVRCCPTGPTLSPRPAPHLPRPWGQATHPLACPYSTDALGQSHTVSPSLPLSLPPHCGPPPPARAGRPPPPARAAGGLALLRRPAPASPSSTGPRRRTCPPPTAASPSSAGPHRPAPA